MLSVFSGRILVLQPRRIAAVAACHRVCEERGWKVGEEAGYQVRFESRVSAKTRLIFMTDALFLRKLLDDPELRGVDLVVIDEFHERNLNQDLALAYLKEQQMVGSPLKLMIMSATLNAERLTSYLDDSVHLDIAGETFPLTIEHQNQPLRLRTDEEFYSRAASAVRDVFHRTRRDVLVFLPGRGEIERLSGKLEGLDGDRVPLHGSLPLAEQNQVLRGGGSGRRRIILATNVAEASVTVDGVDAVVDTGIAKVMHCHLRTGFSALELERISLFSARQRAGRAARLGPGLCLRLWTPHEEVTQSEESVPEVQRVDLSQALLWLSQMGISNFSSFSWFDPPPGALLDFARRFLMSLGAIGQDHRITNFGRRLADFPLPPRLGAILAKGEELGVGQTAAWICAILNERDSLAGNYERFGGVNCDLWVRLEEARRGRARGWIRQSAEQLSGLVAADSREAELEDVQKVLLLSQLDRLCRRRDSGDRGLMVGGRGVRLVPESLARGSEFFVALQGVDQGGQADTLVSLASGFDKDFLLRHLGDRVETREDVYFDEEKERFFGRRCRFILDLPIDRPTLTEVAADQVSELMGEELWRRWDQLVERHAGLGSLVRRWKFLAHHDPGSAELFGEEKIREALRMAGYGCTSIEQVLSGDLVGIFATVLGSEAMAVLNREVPADWLAPSGFRHKIDYSEMHSAFVDVRLQEVFGLREGPSLVFGRVPLTFRLLGPNFRPVQVTSDLGNFWRTGYVEVRKELRARYPKHSWPEDPLTARPEAKGRRR